MTSPAPASSVLARGAARVVYDAFVGFDEGFRAATRRTARSFGARDWRAMQREAEGRLALYRRAVDGALAELRVRVGGRVLDRQLWRRMRMAYAGLVAGRADCEIAETFFNSVTRRLFATVGVDPDIEFVRREDLSEPARGEAEWRWHPADGGVARLAASLLARVPHPLASPARDAARVGAAIAQGCRARWGEEGLAAVEGAEVLRHLFYRNTAAFLVGRVRAGERSMPLVIALRNGPAGVVADAVLTTEDEASIVFGFAWSYFHVEMQRPAAVVDFLGSIMPNKRVDELYTAIGFNKHGKTELYRALLQHLSRADAVFEEAEGTKGLVMSVFTLPSLNIVFKIIKDVVSQPKRTTRREVMDRYHFVFVRDRVGRLADAQEFEHLEFRRDCFAGDVLDELLRLAPSVVQADESRVVVSHLYTERRLRPLNLYLQEVPDDAAAEAVLDYGQAIKDLAAADIFPGDMLLKNFGVSRHGRVICYDYDELTSLAACHFRAMPQSSRVEDELSAEPWFSVGEADVFPEEFASFLIPRGPLRELFAEAHGELLDPGWWIAMQEAIAAGELFETLPYAESRRLPP